MCGRYTLAVQLDLITDRFLLKRVDAKEMFRFNIAPTQQAPVIYQTDSGRTLTMMRWGLVPFWAKDESIGNKLINARSETLAEKPSFKRSLERKRCIVPADGFYEWKKSTDGKTRTPMRIVVGQGDLFGFAGLWDRWKSPDGGSVESYTIITTEPNKFVSSIHNRMPVILSRDTEAQWLDPEITDPELLTPLLVPYNGEMKAYEVSTSVNSPSNDSPSLIEPIAPELL
ncbi:MAG: SOS response-associated peptidase [candidate division Zixibacteria bacterium]|nr:SOS response-associated peptidase [candidate division Zixibacteria bacterium]